MALALGLGTNLSSCARSSSAEQDAIPWLSDLTVAQQLAQQRSLPMFVLFTADWCPPCQEMRRDTFPDPKVQQLLTDRYVPVKIDMTSPSAAATAAAQQFQVEFIPTYFVLTTDGKKMLYNGAGYLSAAALAKELGKTSS